MKGLSHYGRSQGRDWKLGPQEYEASVEYSVFTRVGSSDVRDVTLHVLPGISRKFI
jgi:hypothetical protein